MEKDIKEFFEQDNIDTAKYLANSKIMKNKTKEIYQATARLHSQNDISVNYLPAGKVGVRRLRNLSV